MTIQLRKKPRQMLIVGTMLLAMVAIIGVLSSRIASAPNTGPGNFLTSLSYSTTSGWGDNVTGAGDTKSETRSLPPYSAVESDGAIDIKWSPGTAPSAVVEAQANILPHIKTEVVDGTIKDPAASSGVLRNQNRTS